MEDNGLNVSSVIRVIHMMVDNSLRVVRALLVVVPLDVDHPLPHIVDFVLFLIPVLSSLFSLFSNINLFVL